jgi:hypothetical protein
MSRRRYLSSDISIDTAVAKLERECGDMASNLYQRMILHAGDDAIITGDPETLLAVVFPHRRDLEPKDISTALECIDRVKLISWDRVNSLVYFPIKAFYKYQTYIKLEKRRTTDFINNQQETPPISGSVRVMTQLTGIDDKNSVSLNNIESQREVAEKAVSPSPSPSPSLSPSLGLLKNPPHTPQGDFDAFEVEHSKDVLSDDELNALNNADAVPVAAPETPKVTRDPKQSGALAKTDDGQFAELWALDPHKKAKVAARAAYDKAILKRGCTHENILAGYKRDSAGWKRDFWPHMATWINRESHDPIDPNATALTFTTAAPAERGGRRFMPPDSFFIPEYGAVK